MIKIYKPGLLRDVDKDLIAKLSDEEKIKLTIDGYDKVASDWDKTRQNLWPELIAEIKKYIKAPLRGAFEENQIKILDIGCGNGRLIPEIEKLNQENYNINYVGVDPSKELIKIAKEKYPESENPNINILTFDGLTLNNKNSQVNFENGVNFCDEQFDQVISIAVLHHLPPSKVIEWLKEISRVTKKNTISIFTTWNLSESNYDLNEGNDAVIGFVHYKNTRYVHYYDYAEIKYIFEESGYFVVEIKDIKRESGMSNTMIVVRKG